MPKGFLNLKTVPSSWGYVMSCEEVEKYLCIIGNRRDEIREALCALRDGQAFIAFGCETSLEFGKRYLMDALNFFSSSNDILKEWSALEMIALNQRLSSQRSLTWLRKRR